MPLDCKVHSTEPELVLIVRGHNTLTTQDMTTFSKFFDKHLHGDDPFKAFFDLRKVEGAPMKALKHMAVYMTSYESLAPGKVIASSVLVSGSKLESLINLLFSFKQPVTPTKVTTNLQEACDFLDEQN